MTGQWEKYVEPAAKAQEQFWAPLRGHTDYPDEIDFGLARTVLAAVGPLIAEDTRVRMVEAAGRAVERGCVDPLTRAETRDEVDELIRNAYAEGWREAKKRPEQDLPLLEIDWMQPGGVRISELWCECEIDPDRRLLIGPHHEVHCSRYVNGPAQPPESILRQLRGGEE